MKLNAVSLIVTLMFILNIIVGTGNYFNEQLAEDLYENLTLIYSGNVTVYNYSEDEFDEIADQLRDNPTITATGSSFDNFRNIFFGVPSLIYEVMGNAKYPHALNTGVRLGLEAIMSVIYILFILQIISYLLGGGE